MTIQENVDLIIAEAIARAQEHTELTQSKVDDAINYASSISFPTGVDDVDEIGAPPSGIQTPTDFSPAYDDEFRTQFNSVKTEILATLNSDWNDFLSDYFPVALNNAAQAWLLDAINNGGTGIDSDIEDAIWERAKDRSDDAMVTAEGDATVQFATRGWFSPPGGLASRLRRIQEEARIKACEINRDTAINAADLEQKNVQFAINEALKLVQSVWDAAKAFVDSIIRAYDPAVRAGAGVAAAAQQYYQHTLDYYKIIAAYEELKLRQELANQGQNWTEQVVITENQNERAKRQTDAAMAAAATFGEQAAASLSGQNTMASQVIQAVGS
jgi:hypothetical protein